MSSIQLKNYSEIFNKDYKEVVYKNNKKYLGWIIVISLGLEILFWVASKLFFKNNVSSLSQVDMDYQQIQPYFIVLFVVISISIFFIYDRRPILVGMIAVSGLLFQKIQVFVINQDAKLMLMIWAIVFLVLAWFYMLPHILAGVGILSYTYLIGFIMWMKFPINSIGVYLWFTTISLVLGIVINVKNFKSHKERFELIQQLLADKESSEYLLHNDLLTGLKTQYAFSKKIDKMGGEGVYNGYLIYFNLDDVRVCNITHGREIGDEYLKVFSQIIQPLIINEDSIIARDSANDFVAYVSGYSTQKEIEDQLEEYNCQLKEEFSKRLNVNQFIPNFSYGIVEFNERTEYFAAYQNVKKRMRQNKTSNKNHLSYTNKYIPFIDYSNLFDANSIVALVWLNKEGWPVTYVSENIIELLGISNESLTSGNIIFADLIHPMDVERIGNEVKHYIDNKVEHYEQIYRLKRSDGEYIWVRDQSIPIWVNDELQQINGTMYDITEEILKEQLIKEKSDQLNDIIQATNIGIWELYLDSDLVKCNERFTKMVGYELEEVQPVTLDKWQSWMHEDDRITFKKMMDDHIKGKIPYYEMECRMKHKDGHIVWIYDRGRIVERNSSSDQFKMVGIQSDITDIKYTETKLYHAEKLSALGRLSGGIAHDMNNQLMMIGAMMEMSAEVDTIDIYRKNTHLIGKAVEDSRKMIHKLLDFSKHHAFMPEKIDVVTLLKELESMINHSFEKEVVVELDIEIENAFIYVDRSLIDNAFINFCLNARESMERGGLLTISVTKEEYQQTFRTFTGFMPAGKYVVISFADTGSGIAEADVNKIFEPFYTTKSSGTGMGLSMAVNVISEHSGGINVSSQVNQGTVISVFLPTKDFDDESEEINEKSNIVMGIEENESKAPRIMLVDDETILGEVLSEFLRIKGCEVEYYEKPEEAIEAYQENPNGFDLVILDIIMPNITGVEVFEHIVQVNEDLKVVFLSGYSEGIQIKEQYQSNVIELIYKPVKMEHLYQLILETTSISSEIMA